MKAIITDLDRTLLRSDATLSPYTLEILRRCREKGLLVMAATARPDRAVAPYRAQFPFDALCTFNGARITTPGGVTENGIPHDSARALLANLAGDPDLTLSVEMDGALYANRPLDLWEHTVYPYFPQLPTDGTLYKILVDGKDPATMPRVQALLPAQLYCTLANGELIQVMSRAATKDRGVRQMLAQVGLKPEQAAYFGDDQDDIPPLALCGMGVAVANAIDAVKAAAGYLTGSNDEDGVAHFIENHFL